MRALTTPGSVSSSSSARLMGSTTPAIGELSPPWGALAGSDNPAPVAGRSVFGEARFETGPTRSHGRRRPAAAGPVGSANPICGLATAPSRQKSPTASLCTFVAGARSHLTSLCAGQHEYDAPYGSAVTKIA